MRPPTEDLLSIGSGSGGVQICVALVAERSSIWLYDPELETDPGPDSDGEPLPGLLSKVCEGFTQLRNLLEPLPDIDDMRRRLKVAHD